MKKYLTKEELLKISPEELLDKAIEYAKQEYDEVL